ncbi:glycoside hydrolase family 53 protein [Demequina gelatinilytica]|uniref:glycoside hydrolase family 53 protein n=1 Tax=Demequina gelatinilytica TaxID=1638980 RepID=UPI000A7A9FC2|nr:glycosyl hydrolase 53 family protein [Demequina gelatinilytica]
MSPTPYRRRLVATFLALALAATAAGAAASSASAAAGSITNGGFESGLSGWSVSGTTSASSVVSGGSAGSYRLNHYLASTGSVSTYQAVTLTGTGWWTYSAKVRSGGGLDSTRLQVTGCGATEYRTVPDTNNGDGWVRIAVSFNATSTTCWVSLYTNGSAGAWAHMDEATLSQGKVSRTVRGADLSSVMKNEAYGGRYYTSTGTKIDPFKSFGEAGANLARFKVWVNPADGYNTASKVVTAAKRAQAYGMKIMIDFHYSDTWADPGAQGVPSTWSGQSVSQMTTSLANHTTSTLTALKNAGVTVDYVQVGNEINPGMLWPYGQSWDVNTSDGVTGAQWNNLAGFLTAGSNAAKAVFPSTKVILHLTDIGSGVSGLTWWLDPITARSVPYDIIGLSYYGYWHGGLGNLQQVITGLSSTYNKDVMVVETAYPWTLSDDTPTFQNVIDTSAELVTGYPATTAGQAAWVRAVQDVVAGAPGGRGLGVVYWEPAWTAVAGSGWDPTDASSGNAWENQAFFDFNSRQIPAAFATFAKDSSD